MPVLTLPLSILRCGLCLVAASALHVLAAADAGAVLQVHLGKVIERSIEQIAKAGYAYGPKQTYDSGKRETHIFLPYGDTPLAKGGAVNATFTPPVKGSQAEVATVDNKHVLSFQYCLEFDKPISAFRAQIGGYTELVLAPSCVAGVEYSTDGTAWQALGQAQKGTRAVVNTLVPDTVVVDNLNTRVLLIRVYTRDSDNPTADRGGEMYLKMRTSGDPGWGDAAKTFSRAQNQVWVTSRK